MLAIPVNKIMELIRAKIIGQSDALEQIKIILKIAAAGIGDQNKPLAVLYFAGPTGVGKSELTAALAEAIHNNREYRCKINCQQLSEDHSHASIIGSPTGYWGSKEGDSLLKKDLVEGKPGRPGILVFDEAEKAHPNVWNALLGIDDGEIKLNNGKTKINLTNTIIIFTSNVGAGELSDIISGRKIGFATLDTTVENRLLANKIIDSEMEKTFSPEFIGRIEKIVVFNWLTQADVEMITGKMIKNFKQRLKRLNRSISITQNAKQFIAEKGFSPQFGARPLKNAFKVLVEYPLSELIEKETNFCSQYKIDLADNKLSFLQDHHYIRRNMAALQPINVIGTKGIQILHNNIMINLSPNESIVYQELYPLLSDPDMLDCFSGLKPEEFKKILGIGLDSITGVFNNMSIFKTLQDYEKKEFFICCVLALKGVFTWTVFVKKINALARTANVR